MAEEKEEQTLDVDSAVEDIASAIGALEEKEEAPEKEAEPAAEPAAEEAAPAEEAEVAKEPQPAGPADEAPPDTWTKEAKEKWATLDPALKAEIRKREGDLAKHASEASQLVQQAQGKVQVADGLEKVLTPYTQMFQKYGINPWDHISHLLQAHATLVFGSPETKVAMVRQMAADIGLDLANLPAAGTAQANPLEGTVRSLQAEVARLSGGVTGVTSAIQEARTAELEQGILAFMQDTAAHPFFLDVANDIAPLIETGAAKSLQEAYDLAVLKNPVTRQKQYALENERTTKANAAAAAAKAAAARKATGANVKSQRARGSAPPRESIDDTLKDTLAAINARTH